MKSLAEVLVETASRHDHLCPRQVLGARIGMAGMRLVGVQPPVLKPTGLVIVETDGCFVDGIESATGATIGHRTLRVVDIGKIAATFVNVGTGYCVRLAPRQGIRTLAFEYAQEGNGRYAAQLEGYQAMPEDELLTCVEVELTPALSALLSRPEARATCTRCGEEIINEREVLREGALMCRTCAGDRYYVEVSSSNLHKRSIDQSVDES